MSGLLPRLVTDYTPTEVAARGTSDRTWWRKRDVQEVLRTRMAVQIVSQALRGHSQGEGGAPRCSCDTWDPETERWDEHLARVALAAVWDPRSQPS